MKSVRYSGSGGPFFGQELNANEHDDLIPVSICHAAKRSVANGKLVNDQVITYYRQGFVVICVHKIQVC